MPVMADVGDFVRKDEMMFCVYGGLIDTAMKSFCYRCITRC